MLRQVAEGVFVHESVFCKSNTVVVQGQEGVLLIDPGILGSEMAELADDLQKMDRPVVVGFSTHPHWDHLLWHDRFGDPPRYGTARCAASIKVLLSNENWEARVAPMIPPDILGQVPLVGMGNIRSLPDKEVQLHWEGPTIRIIEHQAHARGHAALLIEKPKVLVAGDMLSDILMPMLDLGAANPIEDYLEALALLEDAVDEVDILIPGHGSVGGANEVRKRIKQDRKYVEALNDGMIPDDSRIGPSATYEWVRGVHERQLQQLAQRNGHEQF